MGRDVGVPSVGTRDAEGRSNKRWLKADSEYHDVLRGEFGLNLTHEIDMCVSAIKSKGTGDAPHPFFA